MNPAENGFAPPDYTQTTDSLRNPKPIEEDVTWEELMSRLDDLIPRLRIPHAQDIMTRRYGSEKLSLKKTAKQLRLTPDEVIKIEKQSFPALRALLHRSEHEKIK